MPPKIKITKEQIIEVSLLMVRRGGEQELNARSLAKELGSSTQPIFSNFENMEKLRRAVLSRATDIYGEFIAEAVSSGKYPPYKASGMGYIRFAMREPNLFRMLFMCRREPGEQIPTPEYDGIVAQLVDGLGLTLDEARLFHFEMWALVHGIAVMAVTSYQLLSIDTISQMLSDVYLGLKERFLSRNDK